MKTILRRTRLLAPLALAFLALAGCDNPVGDGDEHPNGLVVLSGSSEVASYTHVGRVSTGIITLNAGTTGTYRVQLSTRSGARLTVDGSEYSLRQPTVTIGTVATATLQGNDQIVVTGRAAGTSSIVIPVHHAGHHEFDAFINLIVP